MNKYGFAEKTNEEGEGLCKETSWPLLEKV